MADIEKLGLAEDQGGSCDDTPAAPPQQQFLKQWQWPIAFGPFVLVIVVAQMPIANALPNWMILPVIIVPVFWAVAFKGYLLYLNYQK
jgi:uncharacterized membrane protein